MLPPRLVSLVGFVSLALIAFLFSEKRSSISFKQCFNALFLQIFLAFFMLKTSFGLIIFSQLSCAFEQLYTYAYIGAEFVLGKLTDSSGPWGVVFAIKIAPVIIFFGALISLFFHWGIISKILSFSSKFIQPFLYTSKAETLSLVAGLALGQTETPMLVKKYLPSMTRAQLLTLMISCMSHLSCAIIAVYS